MSDPTTTPSAAEARAALSSADAMRRAGGRAGYPPRWFGALTALTAAANVAGQAFEGVRLEWTLIPSVLALCLLGFVWAERRVAVRSTRNYAASLVISFVLLLWVLPFAAFYLTAFVLDEKHGLAWAPWAGAAAEGVWTYAVYALGGLLLSRRASLAAMAQTSASAPAPPRWACAAVALSLGGNEVLLALGLDGIMAAGMSIIVLMIEFGGALVLAIVLGPGVKRVNIFWFGRLLRDGPLSVAFQVGVWTLYCAGMGAQEWLQADWPAWTAGAAIMAWSYGAFELARRKALDGA
jgi:hypothetical protein